jgi:hypothetical protein
MVTAHLVDPAVLDAVIQEETRIRVALPGLKRSPLETARELLRRAAALWEFVHVAAVAVEQTTRFPDRGIIELSGSVHDLTRLDVAKVLEENAALLRDRGSATKPTKPSLSKMVSAIESILRDCSPDSFLEHARTLEASEDASRIQVAYEALKAFVRRNDLWIDQRLQVLGEAYCAGKASVVEIAHVLDVSVADAVALLEGHGYARPIEHISLTDAAREEHYALLDRDRIARGGKPDPSPLAIVRDVIATQRIEGIDARPWFEQKLK